MPAIHLNKVNFDAAISKGSALVDFWAPWCSPCKTVAPVIDSLSEQYSGKATVAKVNIEVETELADKYNIMSIPTVILFKNGKEEKRIIGAQSAREYEAILG